jgi:hypothetical protein
MSSIEVVCPSCERLVEPVRRKLPSAQAVVENGSTVYSAPSIAFGHFCPSDDCKARLDRAIEQAQLQMVESSSTAERHESTSTEKPKPSNVRHLPTKAKPQEQDLCERIRSEHAQLVEREHALTEELANVKRKRAKLSRMVAAMDAEDELAAE